MRKAIAQLSAKATQSRQSARSLTQGFRPTLEGLETRQVLSTLSPSPSDSGGTGTTTLNPGPGYEFSNWPAAELNNIQFNARNTQPIVAPNGQGIRASDWIVRDPFPITNTDGTLAKINGYYVVAGLATPRNDTIGTLREIDYIYSKDGIHWLEGGTLVSTGTPGGLGDQLFSCDIVYDKSHNQVIIFYTPVQGSKPSEYVTSPSGQQPVQQIAEARVTPVATKAGLTFTHFVQQGIILQPDGKMYATPQAANTETEVYGFRDPFLFRDPKTGHSYLVFAANWGSDQTTGVGSTGDTQYPNAGVSKVVPTLPRNDGVIGIAEATDKSLTHWKLLPPLFGGIGVQEQLELPHILYQKGTYYLFTSTHNRTFVESLKYQYPEGMYGFYSSSLTGPYEGLNHSGLVIADPPQNPLQNYAWKATPIGNGNAEVMSFINEGNSGTISPALKLTLKGGTATITGYQTTASGQKNVPLVFGVTPTTVAAKAKPSVSVLHSKKK